jgi:hypothetical protein
MPDNQPAQHQLPQLESYRSEKFVTIYSNAANLDMSPWDFRFTFGEMKSELGKMPKIEQAVGIVMSPQHAKAFSQMLAMHVQEYEKNVGEIKLPQPVPMPTTKTQ